ncbi:MAG: hypothetical protein A2096_15320 [Spirochaetes bacterium GWF1_41_5]|nr:MAG: hypothetical protein A2096_15320 [Spirochaetes bacterium GWF1_41_5]
MLMMPRILKITEEFFEKYIITGKYDIYISDVVLQEIQRTGDPAKRKLLQDIVKKYCPNVYHVTAEIDKLANLYIKEKIIPAKKRDDARHIAVCTINEIDCLVSWNFKHLANENKEIKIHVVNQREGYFYPLNLTTPLGVMDE